MTTRFCAISVLWLILICTLRAQDADESAARALLVQAVLATEESEQIALVAQLTNTGYDIVGEVLLAWRQGDLFVHETEAGARVPFILQGAPDAAGTLPAIAVIDGTPLSDPEPLRFSPSTLKALDTTSKLRRAIKTTLDFLALASPNPETRRSAVTKLSMLQRMDYLPVLEARLNKETHARVRKALVEGIAITKLKSPEPGDQLEAATTLGELGSITSLDSLKQLAAQDANVELKQAAVRSVQRIQEHLQRVEMFGTMFRGLSLGSILLVVALGLAITFGLMGVINMAHGEIMVVGGYATYVVQSLFGAGLGFSPFGFSVWVPGINSGGWLYESYFLVALPVAFLSAAGVGLLLERGVIQFLYRRPLESLLATWGVSLILQQFYRLTFGAANVQVSSPSWLLGSWTVNDVLLGYNRLFVIAFAILIVIGTWLLLTKTPLGLLIRAVMQNRTMASCMGIRTERVNMMTFAFGSGLAGLAGAFLSQIGNVGPSLGQSYIVDSFMVVVVGGVGNLAGTVVSALSIGLVDQTLQPFVGPVMGKITVLAGIILFLQWKPGGLFPKRGRSLEG